MKLTQTIAMASALLLAAGCAREQHAQYDESISPYRSDGTPRYDSYGGSYSPGGSSMGASANQPASRSDDEIVKQVRQSLQQDPEIAPVVPNIQMSANNGTVVLRGTVQSGAQKRQIESIVANASGVVIVDDYLHVSSTRQGGASNQGSQEGGSMGQTSRPNEQNTVYPGGTNSPVQIYQNATNTGSAPGTLNPTSNDTNSAPRLYQEPGTTTGNSATNALTPTSRTNGRTEVYPEKNNQGKAMEQQNTTNNNPMP